MIKSTNDLSGCQPCHCDCAIATSQQGPGGSEQPAHTARGDHSLCPRPQDPPAALHGHRSCRCPGLRQPGVGPCLQRGVRAGSQGHIPLRHHPPGLSGSTGLQSFVGQIIPYVSAKKINFLSDLEEATGSCHASFFPFINQS